MYKKACDRGRETDWFYSSNDRNLFRDGHMLLILFVDVIGKKYNFC
jgi:hypothetical protein